VTEVERIATISDEAAAWAGVQCQALARDAFTCLSCGSWADGAFPRVQRPPAGPPVTREVTDLVTLCRACRDLAAARDPRLHYRGLWLWPAEDPGEKPVYAVAGTRYDVRWLLPDGTATRDPGLTPG
jgi:5-methylcytosine-specific restriction endonuclease McrA